ncbi:butyrophilin subfamily 3 member A2-like [Salvelinus alpinus]
MKTFPTSAVWCFGILFISVSLITTGSSEVQVVGSADPVVALAGDDIILPCSLKPSVSAEDMVVQWTRLNLKTWNVHLYRQGRDSNEDQFPSYRGRTSMFHEELKNGNVSLKLTRVTLSDAGRYRCFLPTQRQETTVQLIVGAVSQPVISIDGTKGWGVVLKCESGGWFPKPEMEWLDSSGTILPADGPPERHRDSEDRYTVRQHVTVDKTDTNRFTCRVQQQEINHLKETEIHVPDDVFPKSQAGFIVGLSILLAIIVLAASAGVYKWRKHTDKVTRERDGLQGDLNKVTIERDGLQGDLNEVRREKDELNKNLTGQLDTVTREKDGLQGELKKITREKDELNKNLTGQLDKVRREKDELNKNLTGQLDKVRREKDELNINLTGQLDKVRREKDELKKNLTGQLDKVKREKDELNKNLTGQLDKVRREKDGLQGDLNKVTREKDGLQGQLNEVTREREVVTRERM